VGDDRWNHNIHLHRVVLDAVPSGAKRALDVGCGEGMLSRDLPWELAGAISTRWLKLSPKRTYWEHSAPIVWPPPETYDGTQVIAERLLPGVAYRRHVLWRYSLVWTKPDPR